LGTAQDQLDWIRHQIRHLGGSSELGDALSTRLQQAMESQNKFLATLSNILKKMEDSEREVVKNLK
jgi:hypothetical protein